MANTYTQIFIHIVFVVKGRQNLILTENRDELYKYIAGIIKEKGHKLYIVNGMSDHIHVLIGYNPVEALSELLKEIKRCSSIFINNNKWVKGKFEWQSGYGGFSYSKSQIDKVYKYIENQEKHHKKRTFREEYIELLKKFEVEYDERYIFEEVFLP
jgi:REP element-mobilizing transposase RayT